MHTPELVAALQTFVATLAFVTVCFGLTKTLVEGGIIKKSTFSEFVLLYTRLSSS